MKSEVFRNFRVGEIDGVYVKAQKPSGSRMACHQWPASEDDFNKFAPLVAQDINAGGNGNIPGVKVQRNYKDCGPCVEIKIGESTSPY